MTMGILSIGFDDVNVYPPNAKTVVTQYWRGAVEGSLRTKSLHPQCVELNNPHSWGDLKNELNSANRTFVYIVGTGDGLAGQFPDSNPPVLPPSDSFEVLANRIVHLFACNSAQQLGKDIVQKYKAAAFIGYSGPFYFPTPDAPGSSAAITASFLNCDAQIDYALADGRTVAEAVGAARAEFEKQAVFLEKTNHKFAAQMRTNAGLLCGPTSGVGEYGDSSMTMLESLQLLGG